MTIRVRGLMNDDGPTIDPTAGQIAYDEGMGWDQAHVARHGINELVEKLNWQGRLVDRVLYFVDRPICKDEHDQTIDLPTQVKNLKWIVFASRNMVDAISKFVRTPLAQEQWNNQAVSGEYTTNYVLHACNGLKDHIDRMERVIPDKLTIIFLKLLFPNDVVSLISEYFVTR